MINYGVLAAVVHHPTGGDTCDRTHDAACGMTRCRRRSAWRSSPPRVAATTRTTPRPQSTEAPTETTAAQGPSRPSDADAALEELVAAAQEEGSVTDLLEPGARPAQRTGRRLRGRVRHQRRGRARPSTPTSSPGSRPSSRRTLGRRPRRDGRAGCSWRRTPTAGDFVDPTASPQLAGLGDYDADAVHPRRQLSSRSAPRVLTFAWNTDEVPDGLDRLPGSARPVAGRRQDRRASTRPSARPSSTSTSSSRRTSARTSSTDLAAQEPRIYPSALPIGEALHVRRDLRRRLTPLRCSSCRPSRAAPRSTSGSPSLPAPGAPATSAASRRRPTARTPRRCSPTSW